MTRSQGNIRDWDDAFANMAHIPGSDALPGLWTDRAAKYRAHCARIDTDIVYGDHPRERLDLIWPDQDPLGLMVFVHGGYWMRLDKSYWSDLAEGARARGWAVALPQYTLAPELRIAGITQQIAASITKAGGLVDGPIRLSGHSAGGHLVTRMICTDSPLPEDVRARIEKTVSISGVHDLRPLMWTQMNDTLMIDAGEARRESPALLDPRPGAKITAWVGGHERPEFIRQAQLLAMIWDGLNAQTDCVIEADHDHFSVIEALKDSQSALTQAIIGPL